MPPEGVVVHKVYLTTHKSTEDAEAACGVSVSDISYFYTIDPKDLFGCKLCWRRGCAPWARADTEAGDSDDSPFEVQSGESSSSSDESPSVTPK